MRIIAGKYKNRIIPFRKNAGYRPSTAKFREALFSILSSGEFIDTKPIAGAQVLDLYAGTGSLSFEALSRGAAFATLIDNDRENMEMATEFAQKIQEENIKVMIADANFLSFASQKYNLVFIDPPYFKNYVNKSLGCLIKNDWLSEGAIIAVELSRRETIDPVEHISVIKEKIYNNSKLLILRYK